MRYKYRICYNQALNKYRIEYKETFKEYINSLFHSGNPFPYVAIVLYIISFLLFIWGIYSDVLERKQFNFAIAIFCSAIASGFTLLGLVFYFLEGWTIAEERDKHGINQLAYVNCPLDCSKIISDLKEKLEKVDRWVPYLEKIK